MTSKRLINVEDYLDEFLGVKLVGSDGKSFLFKESSLREMAEDFKEQVDVKDKLDEKENMFCKYIIAQHLHVRMLNANVATLTMENRNLNAKLYNFMSQFEYEDVPEKEAEH